MSGRTITFTFKGDPSDLNRALGQIQAGSDKTGAELEKAGAAGTDAMEATAAASIAAEVAIAAAAATAAAAAALFVKMALSAIDLSEDLNLLTKRAKQVGSTASEIDELQGALNLLTDGGANAARGLQDFQRNLADARDGTGEAIDALAKLDLTLDDLEGLTLSESMSLVADRFDRLRDTAEQTQVAMDIFGRTGRSLVPAFRDGAPAFEAAIAQIRETGIVSDEAAAQSEGLQDQILLMHRTVDALRRSALEPLIPILTVTVEKVIELIKAFADTGIPQAFGRSVAFIAEKMLGLTSEVEEFREAVAEAGKSQQTTTDRYNEAFDAAEALKIEIAATSEEQARLSDEMERAATLGQSTTRIERELAESTARLRGQKEALQFANGIAVATSRILAIEMGNEASAADTAAKAADTAAKAAERLAQLRDGSALAGGAAVVAAAEDTAERVASIEEVNAQRRHQLRAIAVDRMIHEEERLADALGKNRDREVFLEQQSAERRTAIRAEESQTQLDGVGSLVGAIGSLYNALTEAQIATAKEGSAESKRLLRQQWASNKAFAIAQGLVNTALSVSNAFASAGNPIVGGVLAGLAAVIGVAQVAVIAASPAPAFHRGGMTSAGSGALSRDEALIRIRRGEEQGILSPQGVAAAGGPRGVHAMNRGESGGGVQTFVVVNKVNNRTTDVTTHEALRRPDSPLAASIRATQPSPIGLHRVW